MGSEGLTVGRPGSGCTPRFAKAPGLQAARVKALLGLGLLVASLAAFGKPDAVTICSDPEPAPWAYWVRDPAGQRTARYTGFSVELVQKVFDRLGRPVRFITDMPWSRCLKQVAAGTIDFALDGYFDAERAKQVSASVSYNTLTPQIYSRRSAPVLATSAKDLAGLKGCGMAGASYVHYGLDARDLDTGVNSYARLIEKLRRGRCDFFVEEAEVVAGFKLSGLEDVRAAPAPWASPPSKHLLAAKTGPAADLLPDINRQIRLAISDGSAALLWRQHAPELPYRP